MTCDMRHVTHFGRWTFSKNVSPLAFTFWNKGILMILMKMDQSSTYFFFIMSNKGVWRTAPATWGLLITSNYYYQHSYCRCILYCTWCCVMMYIYYKKRCHIFIQLFSHHYENSTGASHVLQVCPICSPNLNLESHFGF